MLMHNDSGRRLNHFHQLDISALPPLLKQIIRLYIVEFRELLQGSMKHILNMHFIDNNYSL